MTSARDDDDDGVVVPLRDGAASAVVASSDPSREQRTRMSGQQRREQLIRIARVVFAEKGYEAASIEEIAERAKVSKPVVYEHFGGKEGLYAVIVDREVRGLVDRMTQSLNATHPRVALEQAADAFLRYVEEEADGFRILVRDAPLGMEGSLTTVIVDIAAMVETLLAREFKQRHYDKRIAPLMSRALVGMVAMTGQWWLDAGKPSRRDVAAHLVNLAWNGLKDLDPDPVKSAKQSQKSSQKNQAPRV